jgi:hypothetical protein
MPLMNAPRHHVPCAPSLPLRKDMRPEMSPYGANYMNTPNFQALADDGFYFRRCFVQQAL